MSCLLLPIRLLIQLRGTPSDRRSPVCNNCREGGKVLSTCGAGGRAEVSGGETEYLAEGTGVRVFAILYETGMENGS